MYMRKFHPADTGCFRENQSINDLMVCFFLLLIYIYRCIYTGRPTQKKPFFFLSPNKPPVRRPDSKSLSIAMCKNGHQLVSAHYTAHAR